MATPDTLGAQARAAGAREPAQSPAEAVDALLGSERITVAQVAAAEAVVDARIGKNIS